MHFEFFFWRDMHFEFKKGRMTHFQKVKSKDYDISIKKIKEKKTLDFKKTMQSL